VTRADAEEPLRALAGAAVIRPHRDGWLIFMRAQYAWYGTAEAAADALLSGRHGNGIRIALR
jgi:hypothetical protein